MSPAISVRPTVMLKSFTAARPPKSMPKWLHSRMGDLYRSRSGMMEWLGTGTICPFSNTFLAIDGGPLSSLGNHTAQSRLEAFVVGGQHHQDEDHGVGQHAVVGEFTQGLGQDVQHHGGD